VKQSNIFLILFFLQASSLSGQPCTQNNRPDLGEDKILFITCPDETYDLTSLYNTAGLNLEWDNANPISAKLGYHWLIATNGDGCKDTAFITIRQEVKKWLGTADSNWHNPANWSGNTIPDLKSHVVIFADAVNPCIVSESDATAASIRVAKNGSYQVKNNRQVILSASCDLLPTYFELNASTILIDNPTSMAIQSVDPSRIIFNGITSQLQTLQEGKIILSGIVNNAPFGFLRRVTRIQSNGSVYTISTSDVSLEETFKELSVSTSKRFSQTDTLLQRPLNNTTAQAFSVAFDDIELAEGLTAEQTIDFTPGLTCIIEIRNSVLQYAKLEATYERVLSLRINAESELVNLNFEKNLFRKLLQPIIAGPVVIVPELRLTLGGQFSSTVAMSAGIQNTSNTTLTLEFQGGGWRTSSKKTSSNTPDFSGVEANVNAKVYLEPAIDFKLYNQDGLKGTISSPVYLKAEAHLMPLPPDCKLSAGIEGKASVNFGLFGVNFGQATYNIFSIDSVIYRCKEAKVVTFPVTNISFDTAFGGGNVTDSGASSISKRGLCWNTSPQPTYYHFTTLNGSGVGIYQSAISNLSENTTYYLRAYAINNTDTAYGNEIVFTTPRQKPRVFTVAVSSVTMPTAFCGGQIIYNGISPIISRGVCWGTTASPSVLERKTNNGTGSGLYQSTISGIVRDSAYFLRAYAITATDTAYGDVFSFTGNDSFYRYEAIFRIDSPGTGSGLEGLVNLNLTFNNGSVKGTATSPVFFGTGLVSGIITGTNATLFIDWDNHFTGRCGSIVPQTYPSCPLCYFNGGYGLAYKWYISGSITADHSQLTANLRRDVVTKQTVGGSDPCRFDLNVQQNTEIGIFNY